MKRRTLLRGAVTAGLAAAGGAATARPAAAATDYLIVVVEQAANQIQRFSNGTADWNGTPGWYWSAPDTDTWKYLADAKRRLTARWDDVLVCCANGTSPTGGRAAMVRESDKAVVWTAVVPGNPHSVERIDGHGAIVTASSKARVTGDKYESGGGINLFVPSTHGGVPPTSFADSISTGFPGAHGVMWDDVNELLLAIGYHELRAYRLVTNGDDIITGLSRVATLTFEGTGHDLQPDYASSDILYTVGGDAGNPDHGIWKTRLVYEGSSGGWSFATPTRLHDWYFTKSFSRLPDGTEFWVDAPTASTWWSNMVGFSGRADSVRTGARFYKARFWSHALT
ncbi:DUF6528 family protein [Streptomyces sp. NPDC057236]|uniref:DUF6528 family protein n=1 Tax=Streptomyces sp. NPDC057236 TaxID=3346059 RepID=UPI00363E7420